MVLAELLLATGVGLIAYAFYKWATQNHDFFTKRGIKQMKPLFLIGNSAPLFTRKLDALELAKKIYNTFPNER